MELQNLDILFGSIVMIISEGDDVRSCDGGGHCEPCSLHI